MKEFDGLEEAGAGSGSSFQRRGRAEQAQDGQRRPRKRAGKKVAFRQLARELMEQQWE